MHIATTERRREGREKWRMVGRQRENQRKKDEKERMRKRRSKVKVSG